MAEKIRQFLLDGLKTAREQMETYFADLWKLLQALSYWAVPFVLSLFVVAFLPNLFAMQIGKLVDAVIGARGVGTMTIDVTRAIHWLTAATIAGFLSEMFLSRFEGKAGNLAQTGYMTAGLVVLCLTLLQLGWWGTALWPVVFIVLRKILAKLPYLQFFLVIPVVLLFLSCANHVIQFAAIRAITVGSAMTTVAAAGMYAVVACRILLSRDQAGK